MPGQTPKDSPPAVRRSRSGGRKGRAERTQSRRSVPSIEAREGAAGFRHPEKPLVIICGALGAETKAVLAAAGLADAFEITALPAIWHNFPDRIPDGVETKATQARKDRADRPIFVGYADCGTGGRLDEVCERLDLKRIAGPHCYSFFAGESRFNALAEEELGTFYLTDFLARHFDTLIWEGMGLSDNPEILETMFSGYKRLIYLAQTEDIHLTRLAEQAAGKLGLEFRREFTGYGELGDFMAAVAP